MRSPKENNTYYFPQKTSPARWWSVTEKSLCSQLPIWGHSKSSRVILQRDDLSVCFRVKPQLACNSLRALGDPDLRVRISRSNELHALCRAALPSLRSKRPKLWAPLSNRLACASQTISN